MGCSGRLAYERSYGFWGADNNIFYILIASFFQSYKSAKNNWDLRGAEMKKEANSVQFISLIHQQLTHSPRAIKTSLRYTLLSRFYWIYTNFNYLMNPKAYKDSPLRLAATTWSHKFKNQFRIFTIFHWLARPIFLSLSLGASARAAIGANGETAFGEI